MSVSDITGERTRVQLRWRDLDARGHLYHGATVDLLAEARTAWLNAFVSREAGEGHVIARLDVTYAAEVTRADTWLDVRIAADRVGNSSVVLSETVSNSEHVVVATCHATLVMWDDMTRSVRPLTADERLALTRASTAVR